MLVEQTTRTMRSAIERYAKENNVSNSCCQLAIRALNEDCDPCYDVLINWKPLKRVTFNEILNVKFDLLARELMATPFIRNSLKRLLKEKGITWDKVSVYIYSNDQLDKVLMTVYDGNVNKGNITFDYLFGEDI
jgi:hypothetical protein